MSRQLVLVTGGSGFLGSWCIIELLKAGYRVRTTVRSLKREADVRAMLKAGGAQAGDELTFVAADLMSDAGWAEAVSGCDYVLHVASPFPVGAPKHEDDLIKPAVEGTLRVLCAARDAGVKRVVVTSSFAAIGYGPEHADGTPFDENDWTDPSYKTVTPYVKSKALAERAAWDWRKSEGGGMEMSVVNPVGIFGPVLAADYSASVSIVQRLMDRQMPAVPRLGFGLVDVRDAAELHLMAMTRPEAKGQRFLAVAGPSMTLQEVAKVLKARMGEAGKRVPTGILPDWVLRLAACFDSSLRQIVPILGMMPQSSNEKAKRVLGWQPRSAEDAVVATAESLLRLGLLKASAQDAAPVTK